MAKNSRQDPLYEQILHSLKGKILSGVYKKGELLPSEKELIEEYSVSRITVRKTLAILAEMGFVETIQGRGSVVLFELSNIQEDGDFAKAVEQHYKEFQASTQIRLMIEPEIAKLAAKNATKEQIQYLKSCIDKTIPSENTNQDDFHKAIASIVDNPIIDDILNHLLTLEQGGSTLGVIAPENQKEISEIIEQQHQKIFEAIKEHNEEFAYFYMKEHTMFMAKLYEEYYKHLG